MTMLPRREMEKELSQAFPPPQVASLVKVLDNLREVELAHAVDTRELKEGLTALTAETRKLAAAQRRTEDNLTRLEQTVGTLARQVGGLANRFGFDLEEFVAALLPPWLERHHNVSALTLERRYFDLGGGRMEEIDLAGEGARNGQPVLVLAECHTTLGGAEVRRLADKLDAVTAVLGDRETLRVMVGMNIHPTAEQAARECNVLLVPYSRINRERG